MLTREQVTEAVLKHCDGTFPGSRPELPRMTGDQLRGFIKALTSDLNQALKS